MLKTKRFSLNNEKVLQSEIEKVFVENNVVFTKEYRFDNKNIIDFRVSTIAANIGIEVKIKGTAANIYRQIERYAAFDDCHVLFLLTNKSMGLPKEINGKPCYVFNLSRAWL